MNTMDIEKVQLVPKKSQLTPPEGDCKLARINEVEGGETTPITSVFPNNKSLEEFLFIETPPDAPMPSTSSYVSSRPSTAGPASKSTHVERIPTDPLSGVFYKDFPSTSPLHGPINTNPTSIGNLPPTYHSDTNLATQAVSSPIIIRTPCQTAESTAEIVHLPPHPPPPSQGPNTHLNVRVKDRGISASLDDLQDVNFCLALENPHKIDNNDSLDPSTSMKKPFIFRTVSDSTEERPISDAEMKRLREKGAAACYSNNSRRRYCCDDEMPMQLKVGSLCGRCACIEDDCSCRKHAVSVANLPSLRKGRRTPGLDEISYDFMRASGAISGFSQLRSVKGIKHDREKQELSSALSPALAAGLDTHGAVALLAASTRPRLIASMRKKTAKAHSSQEEVPTTQRSTTWTNSFDSGSNVQSATEEYSRCGPLKAEEIPSVPPTSKQSSLANRPTTHRGSITLETGSGTKGYKLSTGEYEDGMNMLASERSCTEQEATEDQDEDTLTNSDMTRPKRPYYCQKAQQFRTSWRTQSVDTPSSIMNYGLSQDRALTMVESQSDSESMSPGNGIGQDRNAQVKVYLTRGSRNPVKTILVNHNANPMAANADRLRARRQRTFSNRNQWRSVQLSPSHDTEIDRRGDERSYNASLRESRESYVGNRGNIKPPSNFGFKKPLFWRNRSGSPFFNSMASITDTTKMGQSTKSSEVGPTSILKAQISNKPSEMRSDEDATCLEPIFTIRQRR
ncbi:unnamed protein product [Rodentolepis nana]|uniref:CSRNP_N domain-containing protein n=1 Tax=Rodentolepis nana TaxID=102285 RepID=A0A0R3T5K3_RODNA|nr:unnamed protein product [Rodentolepis nana]